MDFVDALLVCFFLFFLGSMLGWVLEVFFRRFFSAKKWINPGFLTGPYLPLYGFGVVGLFGISLLPIDTGMAWLDAVLIILIMGVVMTLIEYIAGLIFIKGMGIKLWDYSNRPGNIQGIICPLFSFFWLVIGAAFYFAATEPVIAAVQWFVHHIEFAFVVGILCGIFLVDLGHALHISVRIRKFAKDHEIVIHYEKLKETLREKKEEAKEKISFLFPFTSLHENRGKLEEIKEKFSTAVVRKKHADGPKSGPDADTDMNSGATVDAAADDVAVTVDTPESKSDIKENKYE